MLVVVDGTPLELQERDGRLVVKSRVALTEAQRHHLRSLREVLLRQIYLQERIELMAIFWDYADDELQETLRLSQEAPDVWEALCTVDEKWRRSVGCESRDSVGLQ